MPSVMRFLAFYVLFNLVNVFTPGSQPGGMGSGGSGTQLGFDP